MAWFSRSLSPYPMVWSPALHYQNSQTSNSACINVQHQEIPTSRSLWIQPGTYGIPGFGFLFGSLSSARKTDQSRSRSKSGNNNMKISKISIQSVWFLIRHSDEFGSICRTCDPKTTFFKHTKLACLFDISDKAYQCFEVQTCQDRFERNR